jgi:hypothetical protein
MSDLSPFREDQDHKHRTGWQQNTRINTDSLYNSPLRWMRLAIYCQLRTYP